MLAPQQTIMLASANLRCEGADASLPTLIFLYFEHPTLQGQKRESMSYPISRRSSSTLANKGRRVF